MSLLLCRQENVRHPFYVEAMGIHLYSSQELSYVIYNYPLLVLDGFVGEPLFAFLRDEVNQGFLALKLERWLKSRENPDEALAMILQECDYYSSAEIGRFRQQVAAIRKMHPAEYKKAKADVLFSMRQYGRASRMYRELLDYPADAVVNDGFVGRIWNNLAVCNVRMMQFDRAMEAYERAYLRTGQKQILEAMYELTLMDESLELGDRQKALVTDEMRQECEQRMVQARQKAAGSSKVQQVEEVFSRDSLKRQAAISGMLYQWKQEYRGMV